MSPRSARMAMLAALVIALVPGSAQAAAPTAYVYATSWDAQGTRQFAADDTGALAALTPPTAAAGTSSTGAVASPDGHSLYVVNQGSEDVSQYDVASDGTLTPKTPAAVSTGTGSAPFGIAIAPDGDHVYVANQGDDSVDVLAVASDGTLTLASSAPAGAGAIQVALTPGGAHAYVTNLSAGTVSQYDVAGDGSLTPKGAIAAGSGAAGLAVSPDGDSLYVANRTNPGTISQFDVAADGTLSAKATPSVAAGVQPIAIAATSTGVYASNYGGQSISQYDAGADGSLTPKATASVAAGRNPWGLIASPDGKSVYATAFSDGAVRQYDVAADGSLSAKATASVDAGAHPIAVAAVPGPPVTPPRDEQQPTIELRTPAGGAKYGFLSAVYADYACADEGGSGLVACEGTVADGSQINTLGLGTQTFTVTARDGAGNTTTVTHHYTVNLLFGGFVGPVQDGATIRSGATIPVAFTLGGSRGSAVLADGSPASGRAACGSTSDPSKPERAQGWLRYDAPTATYVFKWRTQKAWSGTCRTFVLALKDGTKYRMSLKFKRHCATIVAARR